MYELNNCSRSILISTWKFGEKANNEALKILKQGGSSLNAVEGGVKIIESDTEERSVGKGGRPDRDGNVSLDACIMDEKFNIGAVSCLENIENPISVARAIMEKTPHTFLTGIGAYEFAISQGFQKTNLLTEKSRFEWEEWLKNPKCEATVNIENHDTIGMLCLHNNIMAGACTTSGLAWKLKGRVGDSPIIGSGLYVDNEFGCATATGHGEEIMRVVASHRVVMNMKNGYNPYEACKEVIKKIHEIHILRKKQTTNTQIGLIAIKANGEIGAFSLQKGFSYALTINEKTMIHEADSYL